MSTIKVVFTNVNIPEQEAIIALIDAHCNVDGFEQNEESLFAYFSTAAFNETELKALLPEHHFSSETILPQNWNSLWESNFEPVVVADFCAIRANFHLPITSTQHEIVITPKMSFGTGHHATTHLVIEAMRQLPFANATVCDFGTGTGVLAILAEKLGAKSIVAIDNDDWSIENTNENIVVNNCQLITVLKDTVMNNNEFNIVLANINKNVLLDSMMRFSKSVAPKGYLVLSGILVTDKAVMEEALLQNNFAVKLITEHNNWLCIVCQPIDNV